jgi:AcrR family transcriptional regulator
MQRPMSPERAFLFVLEADAYVQPGELSRANARFTVSAMPKVTEEHRATRRLEILAAACRCFARDGFHATSIADIISESGLSAGAVYLYFKGKQELIAAVVEMTLSTADELFAELLADDAVPSAEQTVAFMLEAVMEHAVNNPVFGVDMSRVALHAWAEALRDPEIAERIEHKLRRLREHYEEVARRWQTAGLIDADADPENVGSVLLGIVHAFALQRLLIPGTDPAQYLAGVRGLLAARAATITESSSNQLPGRA